MGASRRPRRALVILALLAVVALACSPGPAYITFWFNGTTQRYQTWRALDALYVAAGRDDLTAIAAITDPFADKPSREREDARRRWAAAARAAHGPPVGVTITSADFDTGSIHFGLHGSANYLVLYQDGAVEHASVIADIDTAWRRAAIAGLPGPTVEQRLRACYPGRGIAILAISETRQRWSTSWQAVYTVADGPHAGGPYTIMDGLGYFAGDQRTPDGRWPAAPQLVHCPQSGAAAP